MEKKLERNVAIDILKVIGILMIILAHTNAPNLVTQIRSFDVPLLVILSGILGVKSYTKKHSGIKYLIRRVIRLVVPVWIFLTIFFIGYFILLKIGINLEIIGIKKIIKSYLLMDGIGYVWIIRVYVLCAIALPIILFLKSNIKPNLLDLLVMLVYIVYEILYSIIGRCNIFVDYVLYYLIPYVTVLYMGIRLKEFSNKKIVITILLMLILCFIIGIVLYFAEGRIIITNEYKYPPRIYYLSYAIGISFFLYYIVERKNVFNVKKKLDIPLIRFIASHSMWIYLWHIPFVFLIKQTMPNLYWIIKFLIILAGGIVLTYLQYRIIKKINIKNKTLLVIINS